MAWIASINRPEVKCGRALSKAATWEPMPLAQSRIFKGRPSSPRVINESRTFACRWIGSIPIVKDQVVVLCHRIAKNSRLDLSSTSRLIGPPWFGVQAGIKNKKVTENPVKGTSRRQLTNNVIRRLGVFVKGESLIRCPPVKSLQVCKQRVKLQSFQPKVFRARAPERVKDSSPRSIPPLLCSCPLR
jgi:hypothetical protein